VVVVDDIDMAITQVIRGEDHIGNTPKQILLYEALGGAAPEFGHTPLILNQTGQKLSKRDGVTSISDFQRMGYLAPALANYMTLLGWSPTEGMSEIFTLAEAAQVFSFERVNKAGAKFDWDKLNWLNSQYLHAMPIPDLTDLLIPVWQGAGYAVDRDRTWLEQLTALIGPSLEKLNDAIEMSRSFFVSEVTYGEEAIAQLRQPGAVDALKALHGSAQQLTTLDEASAKAAIDGAVKAHGLKKGLVMKSLRAGLTGELHGPDLIQSWLLLHQLGWDWKRLQTALQGV
jgi:glutamyl-tRNA synthetase